MPRLPIGQTPSFWAHPVRSGTARVLVVSTGRRTEFGAIAARLHGTPARDGFCAGRPAVRLSADPRHGSDRDLRADNEPAYAPSVVESLLFAAALAVGLSPELLPAIISVTLSAGARRWANAG